MIDKGATISTMESCTSGLIASLITDIDGSSAVFPGSFITYSNNAKIANGVFSEIIETYGVYSKETAIAMAKACRKRLNTDIGVGVTGSLAIADPNNSDSVPGEVFFAVDYFGTTYDYFIKVPNQESKFFNKVYVADMVQKEIMTLLENN